MGLVEIKFKLIFLSWFMIVNFLWSIDNLTINLYMKLGWKNLTWFDFNLKQQHVEKYMLFNSSKLFHMVSISSK